MTVLALRELAFATLKDQLAAAVPGVPVERNRRSEVDFEGGEAPRLVLRDGPQEADTGLASGFTSYRVSATVEGHVAAASDDAIGPALNALYLQVVAGIFGRATLLPGGVAEIWPLEGRLDVDFAPAVEVDAPAASFYLDFSFDLDAPTGAPSATV